MDDSKIVLWNVLLNFVGISLWGISMLYYIKSKGKSSQETLKKKTNINMASFDEEMFAQLIMQDSKRSFKRVSEKKPHSKPDTEEVYSEVLRLANAGITSQKICEMVKIPKGEIELIIKLRKEMHDLSRRNPSEALKTCF